MPIDRARAAQLEAQAEQAARAWAQQAAAQARAATAQTAPGAEMKYGQRSVNIDQQGATIPGTPPETVGRTNIPGQEGALSLQPGDQIRVEAIDVLPIHPIDTICVVEPMGTVALGAAYGRVHVAGLSVIDAEKAIIEKLKEVVENPSVQVTFANRGGLPAENPFQAPPSFVPASDPTE